MLRTIIETLWDAHVVHEQPGAPTLLFIDLHLVHEVTSPQAFDGLRARGLKVPRPDLTIATVDHSIPTTDRSLPIVDPIAANRFHQGSERRDGSSDRHARVARPRLRRRRVRRTPHEQDRNEQAGERSGGRRLRFIENHSR